MKQKIAPKKKNSLKTIVVFAFCVFVLIVISLIVKTVSMIRVSKFDGVHKFTVAIEKRGQVLEIASFDPSSPSTSVIQIRGALPNSDVGKVLGFLPDEIVDLQVDVAVADLSNSAGMNSILKHFTQVKTQLTFYDIVRLYFLAKSSTLGNRRVGLVSLPSNETAIDKVVSSLFSDSVISSENVSIQIINASGMPGVANDLARIITNIGGNVVSVTSAQTIQAHSHISYFRKKSHTLQKLSTLLGYPVSSLDTETIADIVITMGSDSGGKGLY